MTLRIMDAGGQAYFDFLKRADNGAAPGITGCPSVSWAMASRNRDDNGSVLEKGAGSLVS